MNDEMTTKELDRRIEEKKRNQQRAKDYVKRLDEHLQKPYQDAKKRIEKQ